MTRTGNFPRKAPVRPDPGRNMALIPAAPSEWAPTGITRRKHWSTRALISARQITVAALTEMDWAACL
jgi:hypothetical protein